MDKKKPLEKPTILLVEKNKQDEEVLVNIISSTYNYVTASSSDEVLAILQDADKRISAAIIGEEFARACLEEIRILPELEEFPVIVSVLGSNYELENELLELQVIDFIKKPFSERRVLNRLRTAVKLFNANRLIYELERDDLTGLYTRQVFLHKAETVRSENPHKKFCVIAFDFDNFKYSNTLYGEQKCNEFLAYTAHRLKGLLPKGIAGRFGGDQFILFFDYTGETVDVDRINSICKLILDSAPIPHQIVKMGINAPISHDLPFVICCDRAFLAIRQIKGIYGKDIAFFESDLQKHLLDEQKIIETMENSLEKGEFQVFYQPKHETVTGRIVGAEALVRWNHSEYGFMAPGQFIPLFERNGFITKLDMFVLEQVCKDIKRWQENGMPVVPVSVNVSRHDFLEQGCIDHQIEIIDSYGLDHSFLHMEVTESLYSENTDLIISQVKKTQDLGFMIEMDDFGSGYSSLGLLSSFPLNVIKLDITFVRNLKTNSIVIENIIKMAHRLGLITVAEGAETLDQVKMLKTLGCDIIQGFYYSKPLPIKEYEEYVRKVFSEPEIKIENYAEDDPQLDWLMSENMIVAANEVAEGVPGGFFSYHADGNLEIISFNREILNMYECRSAEEFRDLVGNSFKGMVVPEDFEHIQESIGSQIKENYDIDYVEYRIKTKKGKIKYVKDYGRFVKTKKYGDIFYVFINDITEEEQWRANIEGERIKQLELKHSVSELSIARQAKHVFIKNVTEDILGPVKNIIQLTKEMSTNLDDKELLEKNLDKSKKAEEKLLHYINNMKDSVLAEGDELTITEYPTDITDAAVKIFRLVEDEAKQKNIKLEYWSDIYNPYIYQDVNHTTEVVMNIMSNALKYTLPGGKIRFGLKQTPGKTSDECNVEFICEDNGIGISKEFLPYVFKYFAREDNKINQETSGAGQGLKISKRLLELMNGTIEITSRKNKGTTVHTIQPHRFANKEDIDKDTLLSENVD